MKPKTALPDSGFVPIVAVAEHYGVTPMTVRRWIAAGYLPARRVGPRNIRVDVRDIDKISRPVA
ncbi:MAG: helix-turn-helix domain-containing protein [Mycobacteriales bacterium]